MEQKVAMQGAHLEQFGVQYLAKGHFDMQLGFKPATFRLLDNPLYLLKYSCTSNLNLNKNLYKLNFVISSVMLLVLSRIRIRISFICPANWDSSSSHHCSQKTVVS